MAYGIRGINHEGDSPRPKGVKRRITPELGFWPGSGERKVGHLPCNRDGSGVSGHLRVSSCSDSSLKKSGVGIEIEIWRKMWSPVYQGVHVRTGLFSPGPQINPHFVFWRD